MALLATLAVTGKQPTLENHTVTADEPFYFLGARELYTGDIATATGITDVTATHKGQVVLTEVGDLLLHGIIRTVEVEIDNGSGGVAIKKMRYAGSQSATIEAALIGKAWSGVGKFKGKTIKDIVETRHKIIE